MTDYSTGTQYTYGDTTGNWQSIKAAGGSVNSAGNGGSSAAAASAPAVTAVSNGSPLPFDGTHRDTSSTYVTPSVYPWVAGPTTLQTSTSTATSIPGLPSGWTISASGKVVPPSAAPVSELTLFYLIVRFRCTNMNALVDVPTRLVFILFSTLSIGHFFASGWWI